MDTLKVNAVIDEYIKNFAKLNDEANDNEGYKWVATGCFKKYWNLDAEDMLEMFNKAMKEMSNLIDNSQVQPLSGIRLLLSQPSEVDFVRESFRTLFADDGGDINARQKRVDDFVEKVNERIALYSPEGSWKNNQNRTSVLYYLNLEKPDENYIFKATEANDWANCAEFGEDIGSGASFSLAKYYRMCDELLDVVNNNPKLKKLNDKRVKEKFEKPDVSEFDDKNHILVYDIMYCAYRYLFYDKAAVTKKTTKERLRRAALRKETEELASAIKEKEIAYDALDNEQPLPDITGSEITHKTFGKGNVVGVEGENICIDFNGTVKKFGYVFSFEKGFLSIDKDGFADLIKNIALNKEKRTIVENELKTMKNKHSALMEQLEEITN